MKKRYKKYKVQKLLEEGRKIGEVVKETGVSIINVALWNKELKDSKRNGNEDLEKRILEMKEQMDKLRKSREFKEAENVARETLRLMPDDIKCKGRLMRILLEMVKSPDIEPKRKTETLEELEVLAQEILQRDPKNIPTLVYLIEIYRIKGDSEKAKELKDKLESFEVELDEIVEEDITYADGRTDLIRIYKVLEKNDRLITLLEKIRSVEPDDLSSRLELIRLYRDNKDIDREIEIQEELRRIVPNNMKSLVRLINLYREKSQYDKVAEMHKNIRSIDPNDVQSRVWLARLYRKNVNDGGVYEILKELEDIEPQDRKSRELIISLYESELINLEKIFEATRDTQKSSINLEELSKLRKRLTVLLIKARKEMIEIESEEVIHRVKLLSDYENWKQEDITDDEYKRVNEDIEKLAEEILKMDAENVEARVSLCRIYMEQGMLFEAMGVIDVISQINVDNPSVQIILEDIEKIKQILIGKGIDLSNSQNVDETEKSCVTVRTQEMMMYRYNNQGNLGMVKRLANEIIKRESENPFAKAVEEYSNRFHSIYSEYSDTLSVKIHYDSYGEYSLEDDEYDWELDEK